jgi:DNA-binding response OmpR family regulator
VAKRILMVDDQDSILHAVDRFFTRAGFVVDCAHELEEAEALVTHIAYDLVIADLSLSEKGSTEGLEIVRYVRRCCPRTRVIILTAYGSPAMENEARRRGCDRFVLKTKSLSDLVKIAAELMGSAA